MVIVKEGTLNWKNLHQTYGQQIVDLYHLANEPALGALAGYNDTTRGVQKIIADAIASNTPLKALGGNWSLSPVTMTSGIILDTKSLNTIFPVTNSAVNPGCGIDPSLLFMAQCGNGIWELNKFLAQHNRSLSASGASNGQTIAGAIATGTHGAGVMYGATQDFVAGLHIITGPDKHIWLERKTGGPIMSADFLAKIGATPVYDDEAFYAAKVSVGAFGFIHGVLILTQPDYLLNANMYHVAFDNQLQSLMQTLNYSAYINPNVKITTPPFHFGVLINPYDIDKGVYMTVFYKIPYTPNYTPPAPNGEGIGPGDDAPSFIGKLTDLIPQSVPLMVNGVIGKSLVPYTNKIGRLGEIFNNTTLRGKVASAAIGFEPANVLKVLNMVRTVNNTSGQFAGVFAFRYVKADPVTKGTLAFQKFSPYTCVLELDGVQSDITKRFYQAVWDGMKQLNIPFTFHWGKQNILDAKMVQKMYGPALNSFLNARNKNVDPDTMRIFSNEAIRTYGLDGTLPGHGNSPLALA